jgi:hypothetical protein
LCQWFFQLAASVNPRSAVRLTRLFLEAVLARGRRTVTSWIRAAGLNAEFRPAYTTLAAAGKRADTIAARSVYRVVKPLVGGSELLLLGLDDAPRRVMGRWCREPACITIRLPDRQAQLSCTGMSGWCWACSSSTRLGVRSLCRCWARLYVRAKDLKSIDPWHPPPFWTNLELAVELV